MSDKKIRDDVMAKGSGLNSLFLQRKKLVLLYIYSEVQGGSSFVDHSCYFCLVFVMLSCASVY